MLIGPTTPTPAFAIGAKTADPITMYLNDIYTIGANLAGLPAVSVPCGFVSDLPVGLQIVGPHFSEARVLQRRARLPARDRLAHARAAGLRMSGWETVIGLEIHAQLATQLEDLLGLRDRATARRRTRRRISSISATRACCRC